MTIYLVPRHGAPTSMPGHQHALPATGGPAKHSESVDIIDNISSSTDNTTLDMWVWVNDLSGTNVVKCKQIVIVYQWTVKDGGRTGRLLPRHDAGQIRSITFPPTADFFPMKDYRQTQPPGHEGARRDPHRRHDQRDGVGRSERLRFVIQVLKSYQYETGKIMVNRDIRKFTGQMVDGRCDVRQFVP